MTIEEARLFELPMVIFPSFRIARYRVIDDWKDTTVPVIHPKSYLMTHG
jgi:hypothetical protein